MNKKTKILGAIIVTSAMLLLAFTGILTHIQSKNDANEPQMEANFVDIAKYRHQNSAIMLNRSEMNDLYHFVLYNYHHYGISSNVLNELQFKADSNFINWYLGNYSQIPSNYRGITTQNSSVILPMWENESSNAMEEVQAVANYEVSQFTIKNQINTTYVVSNHLGHLVSNKTTEYHNQSANFLTYRYTNGKQSLVYELIDQNGSIKPVDPYIRLNAFTIHWGWGGLISGTSYNIYFTFDNYKDALNFKNFLTTAITVKSSVNYATTIIAWAALGAGIGSIVPGTGTLAGAIVGFIGGVITAIQDNTDPIYVNNAINGLFTNQEAYNGQFEVVYTLNTWEWGLVPEFSWWGYYNPGQVLKQVYKNVGLDSNAESNFITVYNALVSNLGNNVEVYFSPPSSWQSIVSVLEGWT